MENISYEFLFLVMCIGAGVYVNRNNFTSFVRTVFGFPLPTYIISSGISLFLGFIFWGIINLVLFFVRK